MALILPVFVVEQELAVLKGKLASLAGLPMSKPTAEVLEHDIDLLNRLLEAGEATADDLLDREAAMRWSGLKKDALDGYPSTGSYAAKRWRRGDMPMRDPFAAPGRRDQKEESSLPADANAGAPPTRNESPSRDDRLKAALAETQRAA